VTIRKLADAGTIIDAAAALVGNEITIGGISFYVDNTDAALTDARKAAIADAKLRADTYAGAAQVGRFRELVRRNAVADRWFQPIVGASSANDMYLARAEFVFEDNSFAVTFFGAGAGWPYS
jgi:uncharacterized protein YggE